MKTSFLKFFTIVAIVSFSSCKDNAKEAETTAAEAAAVAEATAITYNAIADQSMIQWKGFKPTGSHTGTISVAKGSVKTDGENIESGNFIIDMNSIVVTDIPADDEGNAKLKGHLTSADFFDIAAHPKAVFEITGMKTIDGKSMLSGNLSMKDTTNNISFPVKINMDGDTMHLKSETFTIDRSKWNIKYGSKSFFDNLGDKFINDDIELTISLTAKKA